MYLQVKRFLKSIIDTLQTFAVAVLVACFVSSFGKRRSSESTRGKTN